MENKKETSMETLHVIADLGRFDKYYQDEFRKIIESGEKYKGKWNWFSFLFSWLWCFSKGCWAYGLIIIATIAVTYGSGYYFILAIGWSLIMGLRGTWLLYNVKVKGKQFPKSLF